MYIYIALFLGIAFFAFLFGFIADLHHYIKKHKEEEDACKKKDQEK